MPTRGHSGAAACPVQSWAQVAQVSPGLQTPLPQQVAPSQHAPQSALQEWQLSPSPQMPSPHDAPAPPDPPLAPAPPWPPPLVAPPPAFELVEPPRPEPPDPWTSPPPAHAAAVFRAKDLATGARVALKVLRGDGDPDHARFAREIEWLRGLAHPGIVRYVAHGVTAAGEPFLAMEWLEGEDLAARLARGPLSRRRRRSPCVRRAAQALGAAHARGVVHRDVKPSNLFLAGRRRSTASRSSTSASRGARRRASRSRRPARSLGTPGYMAPEQARGERGVDARADVFSLGCVLFECLTGQPAVRRRRTRWRCSPRSSSRRRRGSRDAARERPAGARRARRADAREGARASGRATARAVARDARRLASSRRAAAPARRAAPTSAPTTERASSGSSACVLRRRRSHAPGAGDRRRGDDRECASAQRALARRRGAVRRARRADSRVDRSPS